MLGVPSSKTAAESPGRIPILLSEHRDAKSMDVSVFRVQYAFLGNIGMKLSEVRVTGEQIRLPGPEGTWMQPGGCLVDKELTNHGIGENHLQGAGGWSIRSALRASPAEKRVCGVSSEKAPGSYSFFLICSNHKPIPLCGL